MQKVLNFIKYNNAFTIIVGIFFLGFGVTFAASPDLRSSVYSSKSTVVSVDNTMIVSSDLDTFNFNLVINSVTDDEKNYYATYSYQTLTIEDSVWQNKKIDKVLTVNKEALDGRDLGLYVAKELGENITAELSYLKRVQKLEQEKGQSQKVVTTEYSGLIGKLIDPKQEVIEGYNPVIPEPVTQVAATIESNPEQVIVSTTHPEPQPNPVSEVSTVTSASTSPQTETSEQTNATSSSTPEAVIDESLVQQVVGAELDQSQASTTPPESGTSTPETVPSSTQ